MLNTCMFRQMVRVWRRGLFDLQEAESSEVAVGSCNPGQQDDAEGVVWEGFEQLPDTPVQLPHCVLHFLVLVARRVAEGGCLHGYPGGQVGRGQGQAGG